MSLITTAIQHWTPVTKTLPYPPTGLPCRSTQLGKVPDSKHIWNKWDKALWLKRTTNGKRQDPHSIFRGAVLWKETFLPAFLGSSTLAASLSHLRMAANGCEILQYCLNSKCMFIYIVQIRHPTLWTRQWLQPKPVGCRPTSRRFLQYRQKVWSSHRRHR